MRDIFSKEGIFFTVQVDHLNGEIMGSIFDMFYSAGALNVQCLQTITKKNRPGNIFLIDALPEKAESIEEIIVNELDSTGWHKIISDHRHVSTEIVLRDIDIYHNSNKFTFQIIGKQIKGNSDSIRPEHSNCIELKELVKSRTGNDISLKVIYMKIQAALLKNDHEIAL